MAIFSKMIFKQELYWSFALNILKEVKKYTKPEEVHQEQKFSQVYHKLIHSAALETLLNLEHTYALTVEDLIQQRDKDLQFLDNT